MARYWPIASILLVAGCVPPTVSQQSEVRMADPRTGVIAICPPGRASLDPARSELATCIAELRHYGFDIEAELLAAHQAPLQDAMPNRGTASTVAPSFAPQGGNTLENTAPSPAPVFAAPLSQPPIDALPETSVPAVRPWYMPDDSAPVRR